MFELNDRVVLVCGGAGYLGLPVSRKLAEQGAAVAIADADADAAERAAAEVAGRLPSGRVIWLQMDISDECSVTNAVQHVAGTFGALDIMVNLAAAGSGLTVEELDADEFDRTMKVNMTGAFLLARESARHMIRGGSIILYSSMYGRVAPNPDMYESPMKPNPIDYGVAKAGLEQMVRYLAVYWAKRNIRVNGICPGPFPNSEKPAYKEDTGFRSFVRRLEKKVPLGRVGRRDETAGAVVFLASDESSFVTGQTLAIDGGWTAW